MASHFRDYVLYKRERRNLNAFGGFIIASGAYVADSVIDQNTGHTSFLFSLGGLNGWRCLHLCQDPELLPTRSSRSKICPPGRVQGLIIANTGVLIVKDHFLQCWCTQNLNCCSCSCVGITVSRRRIKVHYRLEWRAFNTESSFRLAIFG